MNALVVALLVSHSNRDNSIVHQIVSPTNRMNKDEYKYPPIGESGRSGRAEVEMITRAFLEGLLKEKEHFNNKAGVSTNHTIQDERKGAYSNEAYTSLCFHVDKFYSSAKIISNKLVVLYERILRYGPLSVAPDAAWKDLANGLLNMFKNNDTDLYYDKNLF